MSEEARGRLTRSMIAVPKKDNSEEVARRRAALENELRHRREATMTFLKEKQERALNLKKQMLEKHRESQQKEIQRAQAALERRSVLAEERERKAAALSKAETTPVRSSSAQKMRPTFAFGSSTPRELGYLTTLRKDQQIFPRLASTEKEHSEGSGRLLNKHFKVYNSKPGALGGTPSATSASVGGLHSSALRGLGAAAPSLTRSMFVPGLDYRTGTMAKSFVGPSRDSHTPLRSADVRGVRSVPTAHKQKSSTPPDIHQRMTPIRVLPARVSKPPSTNESANVKAATALPPKPLTPVKKLVVHKKSKTDEAVKLVENGHKTVHTVEDHMETVTSTEAVPKDVGVATDESLISFNGDPQNLAGGNTSQNGVSNHTLIDRTTIPNGDLIDIDTVPGAVTKSIGGDASATGAETAPKEKTEDELGGKPRDLLKMEEELNEKTTETVADIHAKKEKEAADLKVDAAERAEMEPNKELMGPVTFAVKEGQEEHRSESAEVKTTAEESRAMESTDVKATRTVENEEDRGINSTGMNTTTAMETEEDHDMESFGMNITTSVKTDEAHGTEPSGTKASSAVKIEEDHSKEPTEVRARIAAIMSRTRAFPPTAVVTPTVTREEEPLAKPTNGVDSPQTPQAPVASASVRNRSQAANAVLQKLASSNPRLMSVLRLNGSNASLADELSAADPTITLPGQPDEAEKPSTASSSSRAGIFDSDILHPVAPQN